MFCKQCGYNNDKYASVCRRCGSVLRDIGNYKAGSVDSTDDENDISDDGSGGNGDLRYARRKEPFLTMVKKRFKKLDHASEDTKKKMIIGILAGTLVVCLAAVGIKEWVQSCNPYISYSYGADSAEIANDTCAVMDGKGEWIYFTKLYGDNPGLFRVSPKGGEEYKLSYRGMTQLLVFEDWVYGTDVSDGLLWRVPATGGPAQQVTDDKVDDVNIVNGMVYYIGSDEYVWRGSLKDVSDDTTIDAKCICEKRATCLTVYEDTVYFIERPKPVVTTTTLPPEVSSSSSLPFFGADESTKLKSPFDDQEYGKIISANLDGSEMKAVGSDKAAFMTVKSGYLYYAVEATVKKKTGKKDLITGEPEVVDYAALQMRRRLIEGGNTVNFGDPETFAGFIDVDKTSAIYFVSTDGVLMKCGDKGEEVDYIYTGMSGITSAQVVGKWIYFWTEENTKFCRVPTGGGNVEIICEKES